MPEEEKRLEMKFVLLAIINVSQGLKCFICDSDSDPCDMKKKEQSQVCDGDDSFCYAESTEWDKDKPSIFRYCITTSELEGHNITVNPRVTDHYKCAYIFGDVQRCVQICARDYCNNRQFVETEDIILPDIITPETEVEIIIDESEEAIKVEILKAPTDEEIVDTTLIQLSPEPVKSPIEPVQSPVKPVKTAPVEPELRSLKKSSGPITVEVEESPNKNGNSKASTHLLDTLCSILIVFMIV